MPKNRLASMPFSLVNSGCLSLASLLSTVCLAAPAGTVSGATVLVPQGEPFVVKATEVSKEFLQHACIDALQRKLYPSELKVQSAEARAIDDDNYSCLVKGALVDGTDSLYRARLPAIRQAPVDAQYALSANIKTGVVTVGRTDVGQAKETASLALAGLFFDIQVASIAPHKVVFDAKIAGGAKSCKVVLADAGGGDIPVWRVTDLDCGHAKRR